MMLVLLARTAMACSCAPITAQNAIGTGDAVFIGVPRERRELEGDPTSIVWDFTVTETIKGEIRDTVEIHTGRGGGDCGVQFFLDAPVGVVAWTWGSSDRLNTSICGGRWAAQELRDAPRTLPAPDGEGPVAALMGARWGAATMAALDEHGRVLAYGFADESPEDIDVCPGGRRAIARLNTSIEMWDIASMTRLTERKIPRDPERRWGDPQMQCLDDQGTALLLRSNKAYGRRFPGAVEVVGPEASRLVVADAESMALDSERQVLWMADADGPGLISRIDLASEKRQGIAQLPTGSRGARIAIHPKTRELAVLAGPAHPYGYSVAEVLVLVAVDGQTREIPLVNSQRFSEIRWLDSDHLVVIAYTEPVFRG